jgi:hypothetical protein
VRTLSDEDVKAIAAAVIAQAEENWYINVGKGLTRLVWAVIIAAMITLAAIGYKHG